MSRWRQLSLPALLLALTMAACGTSTTDPGGSVDVEGINVTAPSSSVGIGATLQLTATASPSGASNAVTWSSGDESLLTVNATGLVTAAVTPLPGGTVRITATSTEDPSISGGVDLTITCGPLTSSDVSSGTTLPEDTCYLVEGALTVTSGTLTIEPGVEISFSTSGSLSIRDAGRMTAVGTAAKGILFTSVDPAGKWRGVRFDNSLGSENMLHYVTIENGGSDGWSGASYSDSGLLLEGSSLLDMQNSRIIGSAAAGLTVYGASELSSFADNELSDNAIAAWVHPNTARYIDGATVFTNNVHQAVRVGYGNTGSVSTAQTWQALDVPYDIQHRTYVEADLTVEAGATILHEAGVGLLVRPGGTLNAVGTPAAPITFGGSSDLRGYWKGIQIETQSANNVFSHVIFEYGGSDAWTGGGESRAMVYLSGNSKAVFDNSVFRESDYYGLWVPAGGDIAGFTDNTFTNNVRAMITHPNRAGDIASSNDFTGNDEDIVRVTFGNTNRVQMAQTWSALNVPYRVMDRTIVEAALSIEAGAVVEFAQGANFVVKDAGSFNAVGTSVDRILFRGAEALSAYWKGIQIDTASPSNRFEYVDFLHAGSDQWFGGSDSVATLHVTGDGSAVLDNVTFGLTGGYAAIRGNGGSLVCTNTDDGGFMYYVYSSGGNGAQGTCPG